MNLLDGTKKIFPLGYDDFVEAMIQCYENDQLPVTLQCDEDFVEELSAKDIKEFISDFYKDTGLDLHTIHYMCHNCGRLHMLMEVSESEETNIPVQ